MDTEARAYAPGNVVDFTAAATLVGGQVIQSGPLAGIVQEAAGLVSGDKGSLLVEGLALVRNVAVAGNIGDNVYWDEDGTGVDGETGACTTIATDGDFWIGTLAAALAATDVTAQVALNKVNPNLPPHLNRTHIAKAADYTVQDVDCGSVIHVDGSAEGDDIIIITLLATVPGFEIIIQNDAADGASQVQIETNASDKFLSPTALDDGDQLHNTLATSVRGDFVRLLSSTAGWYVAESRGIWADGGA